MQKQGLGFRVYCLGGAMQKQGLGCRVWGVGFRVYCLGGTMQKKGLGSGFGDSGGWDLVWCPGLRFRRRICELGTDNILPIRGRLCNPYFLLPDGNAAAAPSSPERTQDISRSVAAFISATCPATCADPSETPCLEAAEA